MKAILVLTIAAITLGTFAFSRMSSSGSSFAQQSKMIAESKPESPFACNTEALTPEIRKRHFQVLGPMLISLRKDVRELADGYELEFPNDEKTYQILTEWAYQESLCCPFFEINLRLEPERGALVLRLTGREGTKAFIQQDGKRWVQPVR
jgi:hypothetical protein